MLAELGFASWRTGQREAVEAALEGRDSLVVMPTGGGKSLCYQLPGLATEELTVVVSPLIALMQDQWQRLTAAGHPVAMISSAMSAERVREALGQVRDGSARIVYCSPERFASQVFLEALSERRVDLMAVDEAHCVSEWGHDFRPDYLRLPEIAERLGRPTVMACTATATKAVAAEIVSRFGLREPLQVRSGFDRPNLSFDVVPLEGKGSVARRLALLEHGLADPANRPAIVYCGTRKDTDELARTLREAGLPALAYHAGMEAEERGRTRPASWKARRNRRRHQRLRHGRRQGRRALGLAHDDPDQPRGLLPGGGPRRARRAARAGGAAGDEVRPRSPGPLQPAARHPEQTIARERGWRDYRTIKAFIYGRVPPASRLLDHFGDRTAGAPLGRCCDVCDARPGCPTRRRSRSAGPPAPSPPPAPPPDLSAADAPLFEALKAWRLRAADGKPAYTVAHNKTLSAIAATRPADEASLAAIRGVGPSFISKFADEVLAIVADHRQQLAA